MFEKIAPKMKMEKKPVLSQFTAFLPESIENIR
jgi:hypothetical protein